MGISYYYEMLDRDGNRVLDIGSDKIVWKNINEKK